MENVQIQVSKGAMKVINTLKRVIENSPTGVSFIGISNYKNRYNEVSNNLINIGVSYANAKKKDVKYLENLDITAIDTKIDAITMEKARTELINSLVKPNKARSNGQKNAYLNIIDGLKVHIETGEIYVYGFRVNKTVLQNGDYPIVNSRPKTIAKNILKKNMKSTKYTQYKISNLEKMKLNKETLEF